jgi:hypothetical protein
VDLSHVAATKLVYVIVHDQPHIMNVATGVGWRRAAGSAVPVPVPVPVCVTGAQVLDKAACESALNGTDEWHTRQERLAQDIMGGADRLDVEQKEAAAAPAAAQRPFVVQAAPLGSGREFL